MQTPPRTRRPHPAPMPRLMPGSVAAAAALLAALVLLGCWQAAPV